MVVALSEESAAASLSAEEGVAGASAFADYLAKLGLSPPRRGTVTTLQLNIGKRCNLTVLHEPGQEDTAEFLAEQGVEIAASLPCYTPENLEEQRGRGTFNRSIESLQILNRLGYGRGNSQRSQGEPLLLDLVYNPLGPSLPPAQAELEEQYRCELRERFGIEFDALLTITNMPTFEGRSIRTASHCFGCTAGPGSSCGGALVPG